MIEDTPTNGDTAPEQRDAVGDTEHDYLTADDVEQTLLTGINNGGAVFKAPELTDHFITYSWIAALPDGTIRVQRWPPKRDEDYNLAYDSNLDIPEETGLRMWRALPIDTVSDYFASKATHLERIGGIIMFEGDYADVPHLNLDNPSEETEPRAFSDRPIDQ